REIAGRSGEGGVERIRHRALVAAGADKPADLQIDRVGRIREAERQYRQRAGADTERAANPAAGGQDDVLAQWLEAGAGRGDIERPGEAGGAADRELRGGARADLDQQRPRTILRVIAADRERAD